MARVLGAGVDERGLESVDERENYCPVFHRAVELIGRRWNGPIIRALLDGAERFGEIRSRIPGLTDRLLAQRLRELEREGVVQRRIDGQPVWTMGALTGLRAGTDGEHDACRCDSRRRVVSRARSHRIAHECSTDLAERC